MPFSRVRKLGSCRGTFNSTRSSVPFTCSALMDGSPYASRNNSKLATSALQSLFDFSRQTFQQQKGRELLPKQIAEVNQRLCSIPLPELGLHVPPQVNQPYTMQNVGSRMQELESVRRQPGYKGNIMYLHIFEDAEMSVGIFCLPAGAAIPLHDHPGMTVFSRVLYGQLFVQAFDWVDDQDAAQAQLRQVKQSRLASKALQDSSGSDLSDDSTCGRLASLVVAKVQGPDDSPMVLFPNSNGNIHSFTALEDCAVLDVLSPPYDSKYGRDCTYYYVASQLCNKKRQVVLEEFDPPDDFEVTRGVYKGISVVTGDASKKRFNMNNMHKMADDWHV